MLRCRGLGRLLGCPAARGAALKRDFRTLKKRPKCRARCQGAFGARPKNGAGRVGSRTIVERADGWYHVRRGGHEVQLVNAVPRIDETFTAGGAVPYRGRILFGGAEVPYAVAAEVPQRHPARWLRAFLLRQGKGVASPPASGAWSRSP